MKILVFDIDGTLIETNRVDVQLLQTAIDPILPGATLESFEDFAEQTDTAILREMCAADSGRDYNLVESEVQRRYLVGLKAAVETDPGFFLPVPGARGIFGEVREVGWTPAIATGGWRLSAELRLSAAEIPVMGVPLATASEAARRIDIIRLAVRQAASGPGPSEVVYIGDGVWDVRACRELSIGFVGRSTPGSRQQLTEHGAQAVISDFTEPERLLKFLSEPGPLVPTGGAA